MSTWMSAFFFFVVVVAVVVLKSWQPLLKHSCLKKTTKWVCGARVRAAYLLILGNSVLATTLGNATSKLVKNLESFESKTPEVGLVLFL